MHTKNLQYPSGIGHALKQPFMMLHSYESKNAIESVGQTYKTKTAKASPGIALSSIALYIPINALKQTTDANWEGVAGGALKAGAVSGAMGMLSDEAIGTKLEAILKTVGMTAVSKTAEVLDKETGMLSAGAGIAVNNHMAMAYKGPGKFRTHEFAFSFFPKDADDADRIQQIIFDFRNGMLPRMEGAETKTGRALSRPFFNSPRHWDIEFFHVHPTKGIISNPYLFDIKKSVISSMTVNHDPNSVVSLHSDGSPVQTTLSLTFQEIEFPISWDKEGEAKANWTAASGDSAGDPGTNLRIEEVTKQQEKSLLKKTMNYHNPSAAELLKEAFK